MLSGEIELSRFVEDVEDVCLRVRELLTVMGYSYRPATLVQAFDESYRKSDKYKELDESKRAEYEGSYVATQALLRFCEELSYYVVESFSALKGVDFKVNKETLKKLVGPLTFLVNTITERVVNGWLVEIARRMGSVPASHFDSYNEFKEKWNSLLNELETRMGRLGVKIDVKERAKELGVIAR
jgi:hypothetical protein